MHPHPEKINQLFSHFKIFRAVLAFTQIQLSSHIPSNLYAFSVRAWSKNVLVGFGWPVSGNSAAIRQGEDTWMMSALLKYRDKQGLILGMSIQTLRLALWSPEMPVLDAMRQPLCPHNHLHKEVAIFYCY